MGWSTEIYSKTSGSESLHIKDGSKEGTGSLCIYVYRWVGEVKIKIIRRVNCIEFRLENLK